MITVRRLLRTLDVATRSLLVWKSISDWHVLES